MDRTTRTADERVARFVEAVKDDPRVLGVARMRPPHDEVTMLLVVTTWDGAESLPAELPRLAGPLVGDGPRIEMVRSPAPPHSRMSAQWIGLGTDGSRAFVGLRRAGDLVPQFQGREVEVLHDPRRLLDTWVRASNGATDEDRLAAEDVTSTAEHLLTVDTMMRQSASGITPWTHPGFDWVRDTRKSLDLSDPVQAAFAARLDAHLCMTPGAPEGVRVDGGNEPAAQLESFLTIADGEGFKGDRVLFGEAVAHLRALSKREPVFDQGFVVPTFDAVEAAFALGEAVGGCQPPLIPGVYVGVGVTARDALEFWAAPFVRDPTCSVACVDDTGERDVVERAAGREPMVATLTSAIDTAWERLPALIDRARDAAKEQVDPAAVLAKLHLPRSFVERARQRGAGALMCSRLTVALAVSRAGHDCAPLVARKFGLAAGRVLAGG